MTTASPRALSPHTVILQPTPQVVLWYQPILRRGILTDDASLLAIGTWLRGADPETLAPLRWRDVSTFSLQRGLLDNPAGIETTWALPETPTPFAECLTALHAAGLLDPNGSYLAQRGPRHGPFDVTHVGNFHQQIGQWLLQQRRPDAHAWWIEQKFLPDLSGLRDSPYRWVQEPFIQSYFADDYTGQTWLDVGCGIGWYARQLAARGAHVVGIDSNAAAIELARTRIAPTAEFHCATIQRAEDLACLGKHTFDGIFLCDVLLYYFVPYESNELTATALLTALRHRLRPGGRICVLDPHGAFHLHAWLGHAAPLLLTTEYASRRYRVTPTLEEISRAAETAGLTIRRIRELRYDGPVPPDDLAHAVAAEFPLWWYFELVDSLLSS